MTAGQSIGTALLGVLGLMTVAASAQSDKPLTIRSQGSFFVGGETKTVSAPSQPPQDFTVNQMYVQFQQPMNGARHVPVVMVHGCCLSSKTWETTPDGRMGWNEYFLRKDRSVYLAEQVSRARSGFDASIINQVKAGTAKPDQLPGVLMASHQTAWTVFRFGPEYGKAFSDEQFPVQAADELYKQMIPDFNSVLPTPNPTWKDMAALGVQLHGAVLIGHSESGFFPEEAAMIDPSGIRGIVSIEMGVHHHAQAGSVGESGEDSDSRDVRRSPRRCEGSVRRGLAEQFQNLPTVRAAGEGRGRERPTDGTAEAWHSRQQPYADAG